MQPTNGQSTTFESHVAETLQTGDLCKTDNYPLRTLIATLDIPMYPRQIGQLRGAIAELAGWENDLFHNHKEGDERFARYPLIQYRVRQGKACIFALQEGVEALTAFLMSGHTSLKMGGRTYRLAIAHLQQNEHVLKIAGRPQSYKLFKWLALNPKNYEEWQNCHDLVERVRLLERILSSQLVGFCGSMGWYAPERVGASIQHLQLMQSVPLFGKELLTFNINYTSNLCMPPGIGLGKEVSRGFGWQVPAGYSVEQGDLAGKEKNDKD